MKTAILPRLLCAMCLPILVGCLSVPADRHVGRAREGAQVRTGVNIPDPAQPPRSASLPANQRELLADGLTLDEAVRISLANNGRLLARYEQLHMASAAWLQKRLLPNPEAEGLLLVSEHDSDHRIWEVGADWNVLDVMLLPLRRRLADDQLSIAQLETTRATVAHIYQVRHAFFRVQAAKQKLSLRETVTESAQASYEMARRLRQAGNIKELDLLNNRSLYEQAKIDQSAAEFELTRQREKLNVLLGVWGKDASWELAGPLPEIPAASLDIADVEKRAVENSLDLAVARHRIQAAARQLGIARTRSVIPELHVGIDAEKEPDDTWLIGPKVSMELPLFDHGQARRPMREAGLRQGWREYGALAVEVRSSVRTAAEQARLARRRAIYYRDVVLPLRERITHRTQLQYNAMQLGVFQLIQAKQMEIEARRRYIDERLMYWTARNEIDQLLQGRLVGAQMNAFATAGTPGAGDGGNGGH